MSVVFLLCLCPQHVMECTSLVHRPAVDWGPRETTPPPRHANIDARQIGVDLQEVRSGLLFELPHVPQVFHRERRLRGDPGWTRPSDMEWTTVDSSSRCGNGNVRTESTPAKETDTTARSAIAGEKHWLADDHRAQSG